MMLRLFLVFILSIFMSCSAYPRFYPKTTGIDPVFDYYVKNYKQIISNPKYSNHFNKLHMNFSDLSGGTIGVCYYLINGEYEIEIDRKWWYYEGAYISRELLVYHELEHCIRKRMHTNRKDSISSLNDILEEFGHILGLFPELGYLEDGCPASLMHSHTAGFWCDSKHFDYYIQEMRDWDRSR